MFVSMFGEIIADQFISSGTALCHKRDISIPERHTIHAVDSHMLALFFILNA